MSARQYLSLPNATAMAHALPLVGADMRRRSRLRRLRVTSMSASHERSPTLRMQPDKHALSMAHAAHPLEHGHNSGFFK